MATRAKLFDFLAVGVRDPDTDDPLNGGSVEFYEVGTSTPKNVWTEVDKTNAYTSYTLNAFGAAELWGDGYYKVIIKDSDGNEEFNFDVKAGSAEYHSRTISGTTGEVTPEDDAILCDSGSNNIAISLQAVANYTRPIAFKKTSASNTVTVTPDGSETIDGDANRTMTANNTTFQLIPDADANRWRVSNHIAISLVDLTATSAELNQLDGVTVGGTSAGDIATLDDTQTLTNKTLTAPTITTPALNGNPTGTGLGIADNNLVQIDSADVSYGNYARFTANGLDGRSDTEVLADLGGIPRIKVGTYTGDGTTSQAITGVGFQPKALFIIVGDALGDALGQVFALEGMTAAQFSNSDFKVYVAGGTINSLDSDGFTVDDGGSDHCPNEDGTTYYYLALG